MKSIIGILLFCSLLPEISLAQNKSKDRSEKKPNVLFIYPDQMRRYSSGYWSEKPYKEHVVGKPDPVVTPNIDKLAEHGMVFSNAISNYPLCGPWRGMFMSGQYPEQSGIWNNPRSDRPDQSLKDNIFAITDMFNAYGYNTAYVGKAHWFKNKPMFDKDGDYVGTSKWPGGHRVNRYDTYVPPGQARHHSEYWYQSVRDTHRDYLVYSNDSAAVGGQRDGAAFKAHEFSTKRESRYIIKYLKNDHHQRDGDKPFFMVWGINPPHPSFKDEDTEMSVLRKYYGKHKYPDVKGLIVRKNAVPDTAKDYVRNYFADITSDDNYIGKVVNQLKKMGELDNTIIILTSDHGDMLGSHGRTNKNILYNEAMAVPFIVHWPDRVKTSITDLPLGTTDIFPTAMGLAGLKEEIPPSVQGKDWSKFILGKTSWTEEKSHPRLLMLGNSRGVLTDRYQLVLKENKKPWDKKEGTAIDEAYIFDNKKDPMQTNKISLKKRPKLAKKLLRELAKKLKKANDPWYQQRKYSSTIQYPE